MTSKVEISTVDSLTTDQQDQVFDIIEESSVVDEVKPLSEHVELHLKHGGDKPITHVLAIVGDKIVGYGHLDQTDLVAGPSAELVVAPDFRNEGIAKLILQKIEQNSAGKPLRLWAHGNIKSAQDFAKNLNYHPAREIVQLRRSLLESLSDFSLPSDLALATYQGTQDNEIILQINKKSFVNLPDQASWNQGDLTLRLNEEWFNPEGLLIVRTKTNQPVAFCWTKVHGHHHHVHQPIGEIYVLAVLPEFQGQGLGKQLTLWGLHQLRSQNLTEAMLYVDASNESAKRIYLDLGFVLSGSDTLYKSLT
jgi:mycothiol synthase